MSNPHVETYTSKTTLIEKDHHHKSQNAEFWCKVCGVVAALLGITTVVFISLYAVELSRKHHHTTPIFIPTTPASNFTTMNPNMTTPFNTTFNPNITTTLNPNMTTTFNPNVTTSLPFNTTFNPNMTTSEPMNMTTSEFDPNVTISTRVTPDVTATTEMVANTTRRAELEVTQPETTFTLDYTQWPTLPHETNQPIMPLHSLRPHRRTTQPPSAGPWTRGIVKRSLERKEKVPKKEHEHKPQSVILGPKF